MKSKTAAATFILLVLALGLGTLWAFMPRNVPVNDDRVSANTRLKFQFEKDFPYVSTYRLFTMTVEQDKPLLMTLGGPMTFSEQPLESYPTAVLFGFYLLKPGTQIYCPNSAGINFPRFFAIGMPVHFEGGPDPEDLPDEPKPLIIQL